MPCVHYVSAGTLMHCILFITFWWDSLATQTVKNLPTVQEIWLQSLGQEDPLGTGNVNHSGILAWRIPRTIQSMGSQRLRHDRATEHTHTRITLRCDYYLPV